MNTAKKYSSIFILTLFSLVFVSLLTVVPSHIILAADRLQETGSLVTIVIDPGHGGDNHGTTENGFLEKEMNMTTALAMKEELEKFEGIRVLLSHTDDKDYSLKDRAKYAKRMNADYLFSLHYNASETHNFFGSEVWISMQPVYHAYGYQFARLAMDEYEDMGMFLRGIKTRYSSKGDDYYGIIRESVALGIPAVILEHCHVDHPDDSLHCASKESQEAFGRADAHAVAKYFGLKSSILGLDYSDTDYAQVNIRELVPSTLRDETAPVVSEFKLMDVQTDQKTIDVELTVQEPDSTMLYYSYSFDEGNTFSPLQKWPGSNTQTGSFENTIQLSLNVPDTSTHSFMVCIYNGFDQKTYTPVLHFADRFALNNQNISDSEEKQGDFTEEDPTAWVNSVNSEREWDFLYLLRILILIVGCLFVVLLAAQIILSLHDKKKHSKGQ